MVLGSAMEARWLVEEAGPGAWPSVLDRPVSAGDGARFDEMVQRRRGGEPLQYVLGHWPFRVLDLIVDRRVLIPRPETEAVVDVALGELDGLAGTAEVPLVAVDLGTGSGAIALSLAAERPGVEVWATDRSNEALEVARTNLAGSGGCADRRQPGPERPGRPAAVSGTVAGVTATRVQLCQGSWWDALPPELRGKVVLAVANPPYISVGEMGGLDAVVVDWEPEGALLAGPDGLEDIREIVAGALGWLAPAASLVVEIAPHQAGRALDAAAGAGFSEAEVRLDLAGRERALVARRR